MGGMVQPMEIQALAQRILAKAAHKLGGVAALAKHLGVDEGTIGDWLAGRDIPKAEVILNAVSVLVDEPVTLRSPASANPYLISDQ